MAVTSAATVQRPARWFPLRGYRGRRLITLVLDSRETSTVLAALLRRREEVEAWMDGPAKKATLTSIDKMIAELEGHTDSALQNRAQSA
jgi:hypothetical protein